MSEEFIGEGWAFPMRLDATGSIALVSHDREIEESIRLILGTAPGERPMRPEFGCRIHDLIFAPNDATTMGLARYYVEDALGMWEPRIQVKDVRVRPDAENNGRLLIHIRYEVNVTHDERSLVFPFYRIPGEPTAVE